MHRLPWREVWQRDNSLLDILGRFMHLQIEEKRILTDEGIRKITKETMIFPGIISSAVCADWSATRRQMDRGETILSELGGPGKSNSIAWLAHQLSSLHDAADKKVLIR